MSLFNSLKNAFGNLGGLKFENLDVTLVDTDFVRIQVLQKKLQNLGCLSVSVTETRAQILSWLRKDDSNFELRVLFLSVGPGTKELITSLRQAHGGHIAGIAYGESLDEEDIREKLQLETLLEPYADKDIQNALKECLKKAKRMAKLMRTAVSPTAKTDKSASDAVEGAKQSVASTSSDQTLPPINGAAPQPAGAGMQWGGGRWQQTAYNGGMYPGGGMGMSPMSIQQQQQQQLVVQQMMMQQQFLMQQQMAQQIAMEQELAMRRELALRNEAALTQSALQNAAKTSVAMQRLQTSASDVKSTTKVVKNFRETAKDAATARSRVPEGVLEVVLTLQNIRLGEALKCTIVLKLNTAQKSTVDGVALDRSPKRTDICKTQSTEPKFKNDKFTFRIPSVARDSKDRFVMRLFKIDTVTSQRSIAGVAVVALAPAAKHLRAGEPHYVKAKFKTQTKVEVGTVDVCLELNDKDVDSGDGEDSDTEYT